MNLYLIYPEITLFLGALIILMGDVFFAKKNENFVYISHFLALIFTVFSIYLAVNNFIKNETLFNESFVNNSFIAIGKAIALLLLALIIIIALEFVFAIKKVSAEFLALLMMSTVGGMVLLSANDFLVFYLGLELQALPLYLLAALKRNSSKSSEAGIKYFILGSVASGILLFGIAMIYGFSGTINFNALTTLYHADNAQISAIPVAVIFGYILVIIALFFKVSAAPFHMWVPDVYEGSATIVATFFAVVVKFISLLVLLRIISTLILGWPGIDKVFVFVGLLSIAIGSFGAVFQKNIKRLFAYGSVSHVGFILLAMSVFSAVGYSSAMLYILIYALISLGSFGFLNLIKTSDLATANDKKNDKLFDISSLAGLSKTNPVMAFSLAVLMFSSAGIPPLAGFFSKFYVLVAVISRTSFVVATIAVVLSVISAFYYLRIVKIMYFDAPQEEAIKLEDFGNSKLIIFAMAFLNIVLIAFINPIVNFIVNFMAM